MEGSAYQTETQPLILVSIEPRTYREAIARAIETLRPNLSVKAVALGMLAAEISHTDPILVLCDDTFASSLNGVPNRMMFRDGKSSASACLSGTEVEMERVDMDGLLAIVDKVVSSTRYGETLRR